MKGVTGKILKTKEMKLLKSFVANPYRYGVIDGGLKTKWEFAGGSVSKWEGEVEWIVWQRSLLR